MDLVGVCGWEALSMTMMRYGRAEAWKRKKGNSAWYQSIKAQTTTVINIGKYAGYLLIYLRS